MAHMSNEISDDLTNLQHDIFC